MWAEEDSTMNEQGRYIAAPAHGDLHDRQRFLKKPADSARIANATGTASTEPT